MSLKFKQLRTSIMKKKRFTNMMNVDIRTVTNWEKKNGSIPSLERMKTIADILEISMYDVYSSFLYDPDNLQVNYCFSNQQQNQQKITQSLSSGFNPAYKLFKFIHEYRLFGEGFAIYEYKLYRYRRLILHYPPIVESDRFSDIIKPSDGFVLEDEMGNAIVLNEKTIDSFMIVFHSENNTTFKLNISIPIFPEMALVIHEKSICSIYLDTYKNNAEHCLPYYKNKELVFEDNANNLIGRYIKEYREKKKLSREELAKLLPGLDTPLSTSTIASWENGTKIPSARHLESLCEYFQIRADDLLNSVQSNVYVSSIVDGNDSSQLNLGLSYLFNNSNSPDRFEIFLENYFFRVSTIEGPSSFLGLFRIKGYSLGFFEYKSDNNMHFSTLNREIPFRVDMIKTIIPKSINNGLFFEFNGTIQIENEVNKSFSLLLPYLNYKTLEKLP